MIGISERIRESSEQWETLLEQFAYGLRVAWPGIIQSFDATKQTVKVKLALREDFLMLQGKSGTVPIFNRQPVNVPLLINVPIIMPRAGIFSLTMPVTAGDECLVIFGDRCIDAWWQSGGVQNQLARRCHSIHDGFAILGPWSQPHVLPNYSTNSAQLRTQDGTVVVDVKANQINITAPIVNITSTGGTTVIDGKPFLTHEHSGVTTGGGVTGPVV